MKGVCPVCRKLIGLRMDGLIRGHGKTRASCPGSWEPPVKGGCAPGLGWPL